MANNTHRIRRQRWEVKAPTTADAFTIRERMRQEWEETLLAAFERAFDEAVSGDETIHLPKLELDLRLSSTNDLEAELPELIYRQLGERLRAAIEDAGGWNSAVRPRVSTPGEDRFERLLHYLRTGSLPWSVAGIDDAATAGELRETCRRELVAVAAVLRQYGADAPLLFRLLQLLEENELPALVHALLGDAPDAGADAPRIIEMIAQAGGDRHSRLQHAATLLAGTLDGAAGDRGAGAGKSNAGDDEGADDDADDDGIDEELFDELSDLLQSLEDVSSSLEELNDLLTGEATPDLFSELLDGLPQELRERYEAMEDSSGETFDRRWLLRLAASMIAGSLRGASSASRVDEGAGVIFQMLIELDNADAIAFIEALLAEIAQGWKGDVARIVTTLIESETGALGRELRLRVASAIVAECLRSAGQSSPPYFGEILERILTVDERNELHRLLSLLPESLLALLGRDRSANRREDAAGRDGGKIIGTIGPDNVDTGAVENRWQSSDTQSFANPVANAGLILLHSFVAPLFINTGIVQAGETELSASALPRAAAMLHCLATGRTEAYEFELGLVKVLLGLTPETPLSVAEGLIGSEDIGEMESLLDGVITHWNALKNTSRDGLRGSFLQRKGLIRREGDGWRLQVEPASFDLLLGHLPWGISIIKLPWMPKPIHVEWERP